ncbi:hypothetical protein QQF64_018688 [Cirrhinus molitorella]|uniref:Uncharacterized protein n=1 Tax=Cirrhinus molitorella TaxID=172907 RepID=A0ABR3LDB8_9TELE
MTDGKWTDGDEETPFMDFPWRIQGVGDPATDIKKRRPIRGCTPARQKQPSPLITALQCGTKARAAHHISI